MKQDGKTLMELVVVIAIIGIVSILAVANFLGLNSRIRVRAVTTEIASELRLARQLGMTHRNRVRVFFNLERQALETQFLNSETIYRVYHYGDKGIVMEEPSAGPEVLFHPSGRSATATTIRFRSEEGQIQKLTVSLTGRISIL